MTDPQTTAPAVVQALIRITGPHIVAVCAPFSQEAKETIEKAREKEK